MSMDFKLAKVRTVSSMCSMPYIHVNQRTALRSILGKTVPVKDHTQDRGYSFSQYSPTLVGEWNFYFFSKKIKVPRLVINHATNLPGAGSWTRSKNSARTRSQPDCMIYRIPPVRVLRKGQRDKRLSLTFSKSLRTLPMLVSLEYSRVPARHAIFPPQRMNGWD